MLLAVFFPILVKAQLSKRDSLWLPMSYFIDEWKGEGNGEPGAGKYQRSYKWTMDKRFIEVKNKSIYLPSDKNKNKGEIHEDAGYISYDGNRKSFMLRQFHIEGFVNQYKLDGISPDKKTIIFLSESIENIPPGYRARETYKIISENEFIEVFEIADPGKEFEVYTTVKFIRQKK